MKKIVEDFSNLTITCFICRSGCLIDLVTKHQSFGSGSLSEYVFLCPGCVKTAIREAIERQTKMNRHELELEERGL